VGAAVVVLPLVFSLVFSLELELGLELDVDSGFVVVLLLLSALLWVVETGTDVV